MSLDAKKREEKSIESKLLRLKYLDWNKVQVKKYPHFFDVYINGQKILRQKQETKPSRFGFGASGVKAVFKNFKIDIIEEWKYEYNKYWDIQDENKEKWFNKAWKRIHSASVPVVERDEDKDSRDTVKSDADYSD